MKAYIQFLIWLIQPCEVDRYILLFPLETEAQRGEVILVRPRSSGMGKLGFEPRLVSLLKLAYNHCTALPSVLPGCVNHHLVDIRQAVLNLPQLWVSYV